MAETLSRQPCNFSLVTISDLPRQKAFKEQQQGKAIDFHVKLSNMDIACHKMFLVAQSNYFHRKFHGEMLKDTDGGFKELHRLNSEAVRLVIQYIYSGKIEFEYNMTRDVIRVIDCFQLTEKILQEQISKYVITQLSTYNCIGWMDFANEMNLEKVEMEAQYIMLLRLSDVSKESEFLELSNDKLTQHLGYMLHHYNNHGQGLKAYLRWVLHDDANRTVKLDDILKIIDLKKCYLKAYKDFPGRERELFLTKYLGILLEFRNEYSNFSVGISNNLSYDIIVAGGMADSDLCSTKTLLVNLESGNIVKKAPKPRNARNAWYTATCTLCDGVFFAGGSPTCEVKDATSDCVLYHKNTDSWLPLPPLPAPTAGAGATCVQDTFLMVVGGFGARRKKAVCLDMRTRNWTVCPNMLYGVAEPIVGSIDESVFVIFSTCPENGWGRQGYEVDISMQCYNTNTSTWSCKSSLPDQITNTCGAQAVTCAGKLFVVGGNDESFTSYDPYTDTWTVLDTPGCGRVFSAAIVLNEKIILTGGCKHGKGLDSNVQYDPTSKTWILLPVKLAKPLFRHGICLG